MKKRRLLALALTALSLGIAGCAAEAPVDVIVKRRSINAEVDLALDTLFAKTDGSRQLVQKTRGVLIFPNVVAAGLVVGGSHGDGALRAGPTTTGYYSGSSGSVGLIAGAQSKAIFVLFLTDESLKQFLASDGWTIGADASVSLISIGASGSIDTQTVRGPVIGFVMSNGGLMVNFSIEGTKVKKLDL